MGLMGARQQMRLEVSAFHPDPRVAKPAIESLLQQALPGELRAKLERRLDDIQKAGR